MRSFVRVVRARVPADGVELTHNAVHVRHLRAQGVYKRSLQGNAAASNAERVGKLAKAMADLSWKYMQMHKAHRSAARSAGASSQGTRTDNLGAMANWPSPVFLPPSLDAARAYQRVKEFVNEEVRARVGRVHCGGGCAWQQGSHAECMLRHGNVKQRC